MGFQVTSRLQARNKEKCGADSSEDKRAAEETLPEVVGHADGGPDRKKGPNHWCTLVELAGALCPNLPRK